MDQLLASEIHHFDISYLVKEQAPQCLEMIFDILNDVKIIATTLCQVGGLLGILAAVEKYCLTMQRRNGGGDLPTHAKAHSEMGRQGLITQVEETAVSRLSNELAMVKAAAIDCRRQETTTMMIF